MGFVRLALLGAVVAAIVAMYSTQGGDAGDLTPVSARKPFPDFRFHDLSGKDWSLADHRGQVVLVNFWASWCPPCREETPGLVRVAEQYRSRGLAVVGLAMDEGGAAPVSAFARHYRISYPVLLPPLDGPVASSIESLPTTFLLDRNSRVAKTYQGAVAESVFAADVEQLLSAHETTR